MALSVDDPLLKLDVRILNSDVKLMLISKLALEAILDAILKWLEKQSGNKILTSILLYNKQTNQLFHAAAPALSPQYNNAVNGIKAGALAGSCGTAAFKKEQVIAEDIAIDIRWKDYKDYALTEGLRACWSTPLFDAEGELAGTFAIYSKHPRKPTEYDLMLINEIAGITAMAIKARQQDFARMITV